MWRFLASVAVAGGLAVLSSKFFNRNSNDKKREGEEGDFEKKEVKEESEKKEKEEEEPVTPSTIERPARESKSIERFAIPEPNRSVAKPLSIEKGRGTQLRDIPNVASELSKRKPDDNSHMLHLILFGKKAKAHNLKKNIGLFSGYVWTENEEKQKSKIKEKLDKIVKDKIIDFCDVLNIPIVKTTVKKEELAVKILEFLESPHSTTDILLADMEQKGKKRKVSLGKNASSGKASSKKRNQLSQCGEKRKRSSKGEDDENEDEDKAESPDVKDDVKDDSHDESDYEESKSEEEDEPKEKTPTPKTSKKKTKKSSEPKNKEKATPTKKSTSKSAKRPAKSAKKSSESSSKKGAKDTDGTSGSVSKLKGSASKKQKTETESSKDRSPPSKEKVTGKKQDSKFPCKASAKDQGKAKSSKKAKEQSTRADMHAVVVDILKEVDFNTATLSHFHSDEYFLCLSEDVTATILSRLPAQSFASAACVNKSWNKICASILSRPKLASALSLNHDPQEAVEEVVEKVLSEPIVPHFVIAWVGMEFNLTMIHWELEKRFGTRIPIIANSAVCGIIGPDVATDKVKELRYDERDDDNKNSESDTEVLESNRGIVLVVGFVPGLKVEVVPLLRPNLSQFPLVDKFMEEIKNFTSSVSGSTSPSAIIYFKGPSCNMEALARMDCEFDEETVIVGDANACCLCQNVDLGHNHLYAVALVFAKDKSKPPGIGETRFHASLSNGLRPFGPRLQAYCVKTAIDDQYSLFTARLDKQQELLHGQTYFQYLKWRNPELYFTEIFIGLVRHRKSRASKEFHRISGGHHQFFLMDGVGIEPRDQFQFYLTDNDVATSSSRAVHNELQLLKSKLKNNRGEMSVFGGLIFASYTRRDKQHNIKESCPILENFPGIPIAGVYCLGEIGRGTSESMRREDVTENCARCCLHNNSTVYLALSYDPAPTNSKT